MKTATHQQIQTVRDIADDYATSQEDREALLAVAQAAEDFINMAKGLCLLGIGNGPE